MLLDGVKDRFLLKRETILDRLWCDPALPMKLHGLQPDDWQQAVLESNAARIALLCSRQAGKSRIAACLAVSTALRRPDSLVLLVSPSLRQSCELFLHVAEMYAPFRRYCPAVGRDSTLGVSLANGSRILSLPASERTIRTYSAVRLLVIDEAARVSDELYKTLRPMLAVSRGRLVALSTPFGKRGWFYDAWEGVGEWHRIRVEASQCSRISAEFLEEERAELGERWYQQEYCCSFEEMTGAVFSGSDIDACWNEQLRAANIW